MTAANGISWRTSMYSGGILFLLGYLYLGTGIHSDDYAFIMLSQGWSFGEWLALYKANPVYLYSLPTMYFDFAQTLLFGHGAVYYDLVKVAVSLFGIFAAWRFAKQYLESRRALLFALLFVLYPLHDATNYWPIGTYMTMTGAWIMLSHVLLNQGNTKSGLACGFAGAFWSYASPPLAAGLSVTFLVQKDFRKFLLFILPEVFYVAYYAGVANLLETGGFHAVTSPLSIAKQFVLQLATFLDAAIGPSFWLKIYFSILSLNWLSILVGMALALFFWKLYPQRREPVNKPLLLTFCAVALCALFVFALTGKYPQIAFNLGDRVTYFGTMLLAFLLVSLPWRRWIAVTMLTVVALSIVGLSDHWKEWNNTQTRIVENIRANQELSDYQGTVLFVSGYQYSHLGVFSHIEFFSVSNIVRDIFTYAMGKPVSYQTAALNKQQHWENGEVIDRKFDTRIRVGEFITIYDSGKNKLWRIPANEFNAYVESQPTEIRHWVQMLPDGAIRESILYLMPRLQYVFS